MTTARRGLLAAGLGVALLAAAVASAGPPGAWSHAGKVASAPSEAAVARTSDGVLHVLSLGGAAHEVWDTQIDSGGRVLRTASVLRGWSRLSSPQVVLAGDGTLRLSVAGARGAPAPAAGIFSATAPANGAPWTLAAGAIALADPAGTASTALAAAAGKDGTPILAWSESGSLAYVYGGDPALPHLELPSCCAEDPGLAVDAVTGRAVLAWASTSPDRPGVLAQTVTPAGPAGRVVTAPGSAVRGLGASLDPDQRVAISSRAGAPGLYVAYREVERAPGRKLRVTGVALWRVGDPRTQLTVPAAGAAGVMLAASTDGRLWIAWTRGGIVYATRTNRAATRAGAIRALSPPRAGLAIAHVQGNGSAGPLDLVADLGAGARVWRLWHQQVLPGLELAATATRQSGGLVRYAFRVTDAAEPVANAVVQAGGQSLLTGSSGTVVLVTGSQPPVATASKAGYAPGTTRLPAPATQPSSPRPGSP